MSRAAPVALCPHDSPAVYARDCQMCLDEAAARARMRKLALMPLEAGIRLHKAGRITDRQLMALNIAAHLRLKELTDASRP